MKQIKVSEVNVGDWLATPSIFVGNPLKEIFTIMKVKKIDKISKKRYNIQIRSWEVIGDKVLESGIATEIKTIYRLEEGELMNIKKTIILMGLEDENKY
jgi:hypothetical protein